MSENTSTRRNKLPSAYADIKPTRRGKTEPLKFKSSSYEFPSQHNVTTEISVWIQKLQGPAGSVKERISFAAFHSKITTAISAESVSQLLPLLPDSVNTPATVKHWALVIKSITEKLNPGQFPVITADQPVYAQGKQVQWKYPEELGKAIWMIGPFHIEMLILSMIGDWLADSGWCEISERVETSTRGRTDSFLKGKHVKRSCNTH